MTTQWIAENLKCRRNCGGKCSTCLFINDCRNFSNGVAYGAPPFRQADHVNCQVENCATCELFRLCNIQVLGQTYSVESERALQDWTKLDKIYLPTVFSSLAKLPCKHCCVCVICQFAETLQFFDLYSDRDRLKIVKEGLDKSHFCTVKNCRHCEKVLKDDLEQLSAGYRRTLDPY